jgi:hypothetical protein
LPGQWDGAEEHVNEQNIIYGFTYKEYFSLPPFQFIPFSIVAKVTTVCGMLILSARVPLG